MHPPCKAEYEEYLFHVYAVQGSAEPGYAGREMVHGGQMTDSLIPLAPTTQRPDNTAVVMQSPPRFGRHEEVETMAISECWS